ncbi:MAG TPA: endolytic transglycosylase MltG [Candidatus Cloacimonadota bacterium]|nr:endolytic transglycosylase MltG [Candidatus Cloacimonadota bacterium]HPT71413.1 endolytic transglycosylase MltG [Candidatus Cloacimonadota bacterium]
MNNWLNKFKMFFKDLYFDFTLLERKKKILWLAVLVIVIVILSQCFLIFVPAHSTETIITIKSGETATGIGHDLAKKHIIRSGFWFKVLSRVTHSDRYLKPGKFVFGGYTNLTQTLAKIRNGKSLTLTITIPEGLSTYKTFQILAHSGIASYLEFEKLNSDSSFVRKLTGHDYGSLEGFLYPETYKFSSTVTPDTVLAELVHEFQRKVQDVPGMNNSKLGFYRTLILASIVENEAVVPKEKPTIASVYLNRLNQHMKLESCPTVGYLLEKRGIHREYLLYKDLDIPSPYNTYYSADLPPTPICSPTVSSIEAVLNPAKTNYLFFFADRKGNNIFSSTYSEHLQKQKQFRQMQKIRG